MNTATLSEVTNSNQFRVQVSIINRYNSELETTGEFYTGSDAADNHLCSYWGFGPSLSKSSHFSRKDRELYFILNLIYFLATIYFYHMIVTFIDQKYSKNNLIGCGRLNAMPQGISGKGVFANVIKLRISRQGDYPGWSERALNAITSVLVKERKEIWHTKRRQCEDTERIWGCWLWWLDVSTSQGMSEAIRSWKRQGKDFPLDPPNEVWPCRHALILVQWYCPGLLPLRTRRKEISVVLSYGFCVIVTVN